MELRNIAYGCMVLGAAVAQAQSDSSDVLTGSPVEVQETRLQSWTPEKTRLTLSARTPEDAGIAQLGREFASLHVADAGARSFTNTVALRGLTNTPLFGDPSLAVYLDELPLGSAFTFPSELVGFENAELERGLAHNTGVGRAGTAGVLRLTTPPADATGGRISVSYGSRNARSATVQASAAAGEARVYAAVGYGARDGYIWNSTLEREVDWREATSGLLRLNFSPAERMDVSLLLLVQKARDGVQPLVPLGGPLFAVERSAEGVTPLDSVALAATVAAEVGLGRLSATTSFSDWELGPASNVLGLGFGELANESSLAQRNWSEEIRLEGGQGGQTWLLGFFGLAGETEGGFRRSVFGQAFEQSTFEIDHRSAAAFAEITHSLASRLKVEAGARIEGNWKDLVRDEQVPVPGRHERGTSSSALLPHVGVTYLPDALTEVSASLGSSYKPGGFSAFTGNRALSRFGPERSQGIDTGVTRRSRDGRWSAALRAYAYRVEGYQIERSFQTGGMADDYLVVNAERARTVGAELEVGWRPTDALQLTGTAAATRAELRSFRDPYTGASFRGNRVPYVPAHELNLQAEYRFQGGWFVGLGFRHTGTTYYTEAEEQTFAQRRYSLWNGRAGFSTARYTVYLFGENLGDRRYYSAIIPGTFHAAPGNPRVWGVRGDMRF